MALRVHPRTQHVDRAFLDATQALIKIWTQYDLTWGEIVKFHARELAESAKYIIRDERHPNDPGKRGDEE